MDTTLKSLIMSFTKSIDLYNFLLKNHHRRTAIAAYHIGKIYGLGEAEISDLVIGAALHDIGALSIKERNELVEMDVINPNPHARLGSYMLDSFEPFHKISKIIYYHHWPFEMDDQYVVSKGEVPIESYILHIADRIDISIKADQNILGQKIDVINKIKSYSGTLFHPQVVKAFESLALTDYFWLDIDNLTMDNILEMSISKKLEVKMNLDLLEQFAYTISKIIDSRSEFTISHSFGVSAVAYELSRIVGYPEEKARRMRVAGLLHDIGKIAISNEIIEKNGLLTENERANVQSHAYFTELILGNISCLGEIAEWASHHHESHDGTGYPEKLTKHFITEEMDILSYADIFTALSEDRPYREGLKTEEIATILEQQFLEKHGRPIFLVIVKNVESIDMVCKAAIRDGKNRYHIFKELSGI